MYYFAVFIIATISALLIFLAGTYASGEKSFSLPSAPLLIGFCALMTSLYIHTIGAVVIVLVYAIMVAVETMRDRKISRR